VAALLVAVCGARGIIAATGPDAESRGPGWTPLTGYYGEASLLHFYNQRGYIETRRFVTAVDIALELELLSRGDTTFVMLAPSFSSVFTRSVAPFLPFSPMDVRYAVAPFVEWRREKLLYRTGWDHACHHLILKDHRRPWYERQDANVVPVIFHNRIFAGAGTLTTREAVRRQQYRRGVSRRFTERVIWYAESSYYLREIPGILPPRTLYKENEWQWAVSLELAYPLVVNSGCALILGAETTALVAVGGKPAWRARAETELLFGGNGLGMSFFAGWTPVDQHPHHGRDGLTEAGVRFTF